ncbi:MAG TPA: hypothetical protein VLE73_01665 [Candidatus Saccharimonadales bacterium]|nr:hypothetical protein [Candidatus Saccharimonadales bacterium]
MFGRNRQPSPPPRHPDNCGLKTLRTKQQVRETTETKMVPDTGSPEYNMALQEQNLSGAGLDINYHYSKAGGEYVPKEIPVQEVTYLGTLTCRQMEKKGIEPVTGTDKTPLKVAADIGNTVASLYCRTCPYFGKDELRAAQYDGEVAQAEREAADHILAAAQARQELTQINKHYGLPPA